MQQRREGNICARFSNLGRLALCMVPNTSLTYNTFQGKIPKEEEDLNKAAAQLLQKKYGEDNNQHLPLVKELLKMQGLS